MRGVAVCDVCEPLLTGAPEPVAAGLADIDAATGVLVVGRDVADAGVQPHAVVVAPDSSELAVQIARVGDPA